jgi:hypothetical protein
MEYYLERYDKLGGNMDGIRETTFRVTIIEIAAESDWPPNKILSLVLFRNRLHTAALFISHGAQTNLQF